MLVGLSCLLLYQNCASEFVPLPMDQPISAQCLSKKRSAVLNQKADFPLSCDDPSNYHCDLRSFHPDHNNGRSNENLCLNGPRNEELCIQVSHFTFSTSHLVGNEGIDPRELLPGGEFNRDEFSCYIKESIRDGLALIEAKGLSLEEAFERAYNSCLAGDQG